MTHTGGNSEGIRLTGSPGGRKLKTQQSVFSRDEEDKNKPTRENWKQMRRKKCCILTLKEAVRNRTGKQNENQTGGIKVTKQAQRAI